MTGRDAGLGALSPRDGYRLWAPRYSAETAISFLEDRLVASLGTSLAGRTLLDVGCGTGRRLREAGAAHAVGVDLTPEMLAMADGRASLAAGDVRALPLADATFDVVWCRLVIGHLRELDAAYAELARVCRPGGTVVVTDFHPDATAAGHRRTFRDASGVVRELEHHVHTPDAHATAAARAGLTQGARLDGEVGATVRPFYEAAGRVDAYEAQRGLRVVLALSFEKPS